MFQVIFVFVYHTALVSDLVTEHIDNTAVVVVSDTSVLLVPQVEGLQRLATECPQPQVADMQGCAQREPLHSQSSEQLCV